MEFYAFHLMPWPHLPEDFAENKEKYPSSWVTLSNDCYDPEEGQHLYNRYLDELEYAETLGYDGVCVNEHHQNAYGTMPAPNIMGAMLARRTSRLKIAIVGNGLPLRDHPLRVAEEVAMLDVVTGGRIISGFVRGIGNEYFSMGINPTYSMERFREAHDLIIKSWTDPGPFSWEGKHFEVRYVNVWPRPLQKPHPPIWIPGFGSSETIEWCAHPDRKYPYLAVYMPESLVKVYFDMYRECADKFGYMASPYQLGHVYPVYVGETDAKAEAEAKDHLLWLYHYGLRQKNEFLFPPGYVSHSSMMNILGHADEMDWSKMSFGELNEKGFCIVGSAETVRQRLEHSAKMLGFGIMPVLLHFGDMPHDKTIRNMEMFANEVMPHLRGIHPKAESEQPALAAAD
jgi:alkanesulfonate monooxygenase SsuD/methylene tetrahydromethanopterin reductase-like flavin-dependent oxidoreductase (luciferase family)